MIQTIDEVILRMDEIVEECQRSGSRIGYFAVLYRHVTIRIKLGIFNNEFDDNLRMEHLDILFAQRFFDAYDLYQKNEIPSRSWLKAFDEAKSNKHLVLQHLFLGINAHINLDLGIAASETMRGKQLPDIQNDFNKINTILSELVDGVKSNINIISPVFSWLIRWAKGKDELLLNFSIRLARDGAWRFAHDYHLATDKEFCINQRDLVIADLAQKLSHPGNHLSKVVWLISFFEWKSVPVIMNRLSDISEKV